MRHVSVLKEHALTYLQSRFQQLFLSMQNTSKWSEKTKERYKLCWAPRIKPKTNGKYNLKRLCYIWDVGSFMKLNKLLRKVCKHILRQEDYGQFWSSCSIQKVRLKLILIKFNRHLKRPWRKFLNLGKYGVKVLDLRWVNILATNGSTWIRP